MKRAAVGWVILLHIACLNLGNSLAQPRNVEFVTHLSSPGKLEIVRHPPAPDYSRMRGRGEIKALPSYDAESREIWQVDIRSMDLSSLDLRERLYDLMHADFDSKTVWPKQLPPEFDVPRIMELGKNPGLGLRSIHEEGITGKGVGVAIIDQSLLVDHVEYRDQLRLYEEIHVPKGVPAEMHGPAVASIAVGKNVGVAPEADLYYISEQHGRPTRNGGWEFDLTSLAQSIDRVVEINGMLPPENRIRVVSISLGISPRMGGYELVQRAIARAREEGIYAAYVGSGPFHGLGRNPLADPERFDSYTPPQSWMHVWKNLTGYLLVPMDARCIAAPTGKTDYMFNAGGGMSWAVPWVAGLYALACQVEPDITAEKFWQRARETSAKATMERDGKAVEFGNIINPVGVIDALGQKPEKPQ